MGISAKLVRITKACTYESKSKKKFGGKVSDEFPVITGLRKGEVISPDRFNIALASEAKEIKMDKNNELKVAYFADNIVLIAEIKN